MQIDAGKVLTGLFDAKTYFGKLGGRKFLVTLGSSLGLTTQGDALPWYGWLVTGTITCVYVIMQTWMDVKTQGKSSTSVSA